MKRGYWQWLKRLSVVLAAPRPEPAEHAQRIVTLQRNIMLPARLLVVAVALYQLYQSPWLSIPVNTSGVVFETVRTVLTLSAVFMAVATVLFYVVRRFPPVLVQVMVFAVGLADGIFLGGLTVLTDGFESILYWVYPALIVVNAVSIPLATPQIVLNLMLCVLFLCAGVLEYSAEPELNLPSLNPRVKRPDGSTKFKAVEIKQPQAVAAWLNAAPEPVNRLVSNALAEVTRPPQPTDTTPNATNETLRTAVALELNSLFFPMPIRVSDPGRGTEHIEPPSDPNILRVAVLLLLTFCCYGVQVLVARQRREEVEQQEFGLRTQQLRSAGRLAAEVAHQLKNPLAIINNAAFSLHRALHDGRADSLKAVEIIQEEVARADQIITQIMGYAQLSEGRVEKLSVVEELDRALEQVFPAAVTTGIQIHRQYADSFPPLLMQRGHLAETLINVLQNAREAINGQGHVHVSAKCHGDYTVEISVRDSGPGIAPDKLERIFEAYYTTKERGTGLGLAMVKHNVELYGGTVRVESELGNGAKFVLLFPAKTLVRLAASP